MEIFPWGHDKPYNDYSSYVKKTFGRRVQKISIDAGFTCPNRDGSKGQGGCTYCDNKTFNPFYCTPQKSVYQQLEEGIGFFSEKYKAQEYLAYFQAFSNTYATLDRLKSVYSQAFLHPKVVGAVIATRPDCINDEILAYIQFLSKKYYIVVEYGVESTLNSTLEFINRGHSFDDSVKAIESTIALGIRTGAHLILGLPNESEADMLTHARNLAQLPLFSLKLHQLQIIRNTSMAKQFAKEPQRFLSFSVDEYIDLTIRFLELLNPGIIAERFISESPPDKLISPKWNRIKNYEFVAKLEKEMRARKTFQGRLFQ